MTWNINVSKCELIAYPGCNVTDTTARRPGLSQKDCFFSGRGSGGKIAD